MYWEYSRENGKREAASKKEKNGGMLDIFSKFFIPRRLCSFELLLLVLRRKERMRGEERENEERIKYVVVLNYLSFFLL